MLIGGHRHPLVGHREHGQYHGGCGRGRRRGANCAANAPILIGIQGNERITAEEVARRLDTINYEVTCALTPRVPRIYHRDGVALADGAAAAGIAHGGRAGHMSAALDAARSALAGQRAWLVGGAVRDRLLGRPTADVDIVVEGDPALAAKRDLARGRARGLLCAVGGVRLLAGGRA